MRQRGATPLLRVLGVLALAWRFAGVATAQERTAFDTSFGRREPGREFYTDVQGYCQHHFGAVVHGGWTLLAHSDVDAVAGGGDRAASALTLAPAALPATLCHRGMFGSGAYEQDGTLFNATHHCAPHVANASVLLGEVDVLNQPSTCGCLQAPQCTRGKFCDFDCGCRSGGNTSSVTAIHDALEGAEAVLFHGRLRLELGRADNVTCLWNVTAQKACFAATGGASTSCDASAVLASPVPAVPGSDSSALVQAAAVNGSVPVSAVVLRGYVLHVHPTVAEDNSLAFTCADDEASNYAAWSCRVEGLYAITGANASDGSGRLLPGTFQQQFSMSFIPGAAPMVAVHSGLLLAGFLWALHAVVQNAVP